MNRFSPLLFLCILFFYSDLSGQLYEIPLNSKISTASMIAEGKVIKSQSYYGQDNEIYTAHKITLSKIWKGDVTKDEVSIITLGGMVDGRLSTWSNLLTLQEGEQGVFFLQETLRPKIENFNFPDPTFEVYSSQQGFLKYKDDGNNNYAYAPFSTYLNVERELFDILRQNVGEETLISSVNGPEEPNKKCIIYSFDPITESITSSFKIGADISIRTTEGDKYLYQSLVILEYDTSFFGSSIVANGGLEIYDGDISSFSNYTLSAVDLSPSKLQVKLESSSTNNLFTITDQKSQLASVYLHIANPLGNAAVSFDQVAMEQGNLFYDPVSGLIKPFDCIRIENDAFPVVCPNITSFSPDTLAAGAGDVITIVGTDFGPSNPNIPPMGSGALFTQVQSSGSVGHNWVTPFKTDYLFWSDTLIQVKVPSLGWDLAGGLNTGNIAASGEVGVMRDGCIDSTTTDLYIKFAAINQGIADPVTSSPITLPTKLTSRNGAGGYDLYFSNSFKTFDTLAPAAFNRALTTWRCATGVNFRMKDSLAAIPAMYQSNACEIDYGTMPAGVPATLVALTSLDSISYCGTSTTIWYGFQEEFSLIFNNATTWHTQTTTPVLNWIDTLDLETVALHELGHAHQLLHTNNTSNLLHYLANNYQRTIEPDDLCGGMHIMQISAIDTLPNCQPAMQAVPSSDCGNISTGIFNVYNDDIQIKLFPNPTKGILNIEIEEQINLVNDNLYLTVFNSIGKKLDNRRIYNSKEQLSIGAFSSGIYIFVLSIDGIPVKSFKVVKQ